MKQTKISNLVILCLVIISTSQTLSAQTQKGNWLAEGNLGNLTVTNNKNTSTSGSFTNKAENTGYSVSLYPRVGYFLNNNLVIGATLNFSYLTNNYVAYWDNGVKSSKEKTNMSSVGLSPFVRYYFTKNTKNRFYGQLGCGMGIDVLNHENGTTFYDTGDISGNHDSKTTGQSISGEAMIGFNHFFNENIAFNSAIGYNYSKKTQNSTLNSDYGGTVYAPQNNTSTNIIGNVVWNFGFTIIIGGKKVN